MKVASYMHMNNTSSSAILICHSSSELHNYMTQAAHIIDVYVHFMAARRITYIFYVSIIDSC